jgi:hypothetical protein
MMYTQDTRELWSSSVSDGINSTMNHPEVPDGSLKFRMVHFVDFMNYISVYTRILVWMSTPRSSSSTHECWTGNRISLTVAQYCAGCLRVILAIIISVLIPGNEISCIVIHSVGVCALDTGRDYSNARTIQVSAGEFWEENWIIPCKPICFACLAVSFNPQQQRAAPIIIGW